MSSLKDIFDCQGDSRVGDSIQLSGIQSNNLDSSKKKGQNFNEGSNKVIRVWLETKLQRLKLVCLQQFIVLVCLQHRIFSQENNTIFAVLRRITVYLVLGEVLILYVTIIIHLLALFSSYKLSYASYILIMSIAFMISSSLILTTCSVRVLWSLPSSLQQTPTPNFCFLEPFLVTSFRYCCQFQLSKVNTRNLTPLSNFKVSPFVNK